MPGLQPLKLALTRPFWPPLPAQGKSGVGRNCKRTMQPR